MLVKVLRLTNFFLIFVNSFNVREIPLPYLRSFLDTFQSCSFNLKHFKIKNKIPRIYFKNVYENLYVFLEKSDN